jgi:hypothetical protein
MNSNRIIPTEELTEEAFLTLYEQMKKSWGETLANAAVGIPQETLLYQGQLDEFYSSSGARLDNSSICALCSGPIDNPEETSAPNTPFGGICRNCRSQLNSSIEEDD